MTKVLNDQTDTKSCCLCQLPTKSITYVQLFPENYARNADSSLTSLAGSQLTRRLLENAGHRLEDRLLLLRRRRLDLHLYLALPPPRINVVVVALQKAHLQHNNTRYTLCIVSRTNVRTNVHAQSLLPFLCQLPFYPSIVYVQRYEPTKTG